MERRRQLAATIEPFDSFWEAPEDIEKGYRSFYLFYKSNYGRFFPKNPEARILCVSCGPGYGVNLLKDLGYKDVLGIDSFASKIEWARQRQLNCREDFAFECLESATDGFYDLIWLEQEINHLTRQEILDFLSLCYRKLKPNGRLLTFVLNGANPITGAEALAQNFDHFNTMTEYSLRQILAHAGFGGIEVFDLNLYVFYTNPMNYVAMAASWLLAATFRAIFMLYGKKNRLFAKKIGASALRLS